MGIRTRGRPLQRWGGAVAACLLVAGCAAPGPSPSAASPSTPATPAARPSPAAPSDPGPNDAAELAADWVVVTYVGTREFDSNLMAALAPTEYEADQALRAAEAGRLDGNEFGDHEYLLYFVGDDRAAMWGILQPVLDRAPRRWSRVELRHGLDDASPTVLRD